MNNTKARRIVLVILAVIIVAVVAFLMLQPVKTLEKAVNINTHGQPTIGKKSAKIHIIAFEDLKCGNCAIFTNSLLPKIRKKYIDTGIARYTVFNVAFIPGSLPAANAARCLYEQNNDYFFAFVDYLYQHQPSENQDWATVAKLMEFAREATPTANMPQLSRCMITGKYNNVLHNNLRYANDLMHGELATPTVYINGHKLHSMSMSGVDNIIATIDSKAGTQAK